MLDGFYRGLGSVSRLCITCRGRDRVEGCGFFKKREFVRKFTRI